MRHMDPSLTILVIINPGILIAVVRRQAAVAQGCRCAAAVKVETVLQN